MKNLQIALAAAILLMLPLQHSSSADGNNTRITDTNTVFHRVYVLGEPVNFLDRGAARDDYEDLSTALEKSENQAPGSTTQLLEQPTSFQLRKALENLAKTAKPGEEVTLYIVGHGTQSEKGPDEQINETVQLDATNVLEDDFLDGMLEDFDPDVTITVLLDVCYGGGFADGENDLKESPNVAVIGVPTRCPTDIFSWAIDTLTEDIASSTEVGEGDTNSDGMVTTDELKDYLDAQGWSLGAPSDPGPVKKRNDPPTVGKISAVLSPPSTFYSVEASDPDGDLLQYTWTNSNKCGTFSFTDHQAVWDHPHPLCEGDTFHPGTIEVVVSDGRNKVSNSYTDGSNSGESAGEGVLFSKGLINIGSTGVANLKKAAEGFAKGNHQVSVEMSAN